MSEHTPGPWLVDTGRPRRTTIVARTGNNAPGASRFVEIADVLERRNTRLIMAAPDLLDAVRQHIWAAEHDDEAELLNSRLSMRLAIAKVEDSGRTGS